ncbi:ABC transporter ATP-binding protein [Paenibacillaceae bacterium]|nr:ABC transporter ATP-binding protein [Paenibacillaceae bacterium]
MTKSRKLTPVYLWLLAYFRPYLRLLVLLILCGLTISLIQLAIPKGIQYFIDEIIPGRHYSLFWKLIAAMAIAVLLMFGAMAAQNLLRRVIQEKASRDVQFDIFRHLRKLGFPYFEKRPIGESLSFMNTEVASLHNFYRWLVPGMIEMTLFVLLSLLLMLSISVQLALVIPPCLILYYCVGPTIERKAALLSRSTAEHRVQFNQKAYESVASLTELRAHHAEAWDSERLQDKQHSFLQVWVRALWFAYWRGTVRRLSNFSGAIAIIAYGIFLVQNDLLSTGGMAAFLMLYFQTMHQLTVVITLITEQKIMLAQAEKIYDFIQTEPDVKEAVECVELPHISGEISLSNVGFHYPDGTKVLRNFNLAIHPGQRVALVGASGNGKSTLLKLMVRFYDPQQGEILLDGIPLRQLSFAQIRDSIGYVFQETYLFGASVRDNILFGNPEASEQEMIDAAKAAYAHDFIMALPGGYDTELGERGVKLSGGQKQRISIARLLIKNPAIVLLDEATSALDNTSEQEVQSALDRLLAGRTTIAVAHRLSTVQDYDAIVVIRDGEVAEIGTHAELMGRQGEYFQLASGAGLRKSEVVI